jgi:hypothetical protein
MSEYPIESASEVIVHLNEKKPIRVLHVDDGSTTKELKRTSLDLSMKMTAWAYRRMRSRRSLTRVTCLARDQAMDFTS